MTERISLRRLHAFVACAEAGTMTGAARRLFVTQGAVSIAISQLERQIGVQLLLRSKAKGLTLTEAGRVLLPEARSLLARADALQTGMRDLGNAPSGSLVIGCFTTIAPFLLPRVLEEFQAAHPQVTLDFVEGSLTDLQQLLLDGTCELAVLYGVDIQAGIEYDTLYPTQPYVLLPPSHPLAEKGEIRLADLADHDMIALDVPPSLRYFNEVLSSAGVSPRIRHRTESFEMVRSLVARGVGYSLLIQRPIADVSYEGRGVVIRRIKDDILPLDVVLARPAGVRLTRRADAFSAFCRASAPLR
ncbi:LysR family transcriptional regulator [Streptomyces filamentosus]|uniref:LysR family transcriptional regulator n=1 Tax=Streptomyces filamentosus TaxID=67294 RepID=UPI00123845FC|nr:LysR family transcriptional regulator [Streptomyces filamentosus]KAA6216236.1 LysR family transcriptional regulator [Streptomyces filamentosus]